jgi:hypothetical protein
MSVVRKRRKRLRELLKMRLKPGRNWKRDIINAGSPSISSERFKA